MDLKLNEKRALITGSSSGIGEGIAKVLAREGVISVVHCRREEEAKRVAQEIEADGGKAIVAIGDLSTDEGARQVADQVLSSLDGVDILINSAGKATDSSWTDTTTEHWTQTYNINVISMVRALKMLLPQMKQFGWGRIIQIAGTVATQPFAVGPDYGSSKAAIVNLTVSLAKELAGTGITVNTISPGAIVTAAAEHQFRKMAESKGWGTDWAEIEKHLLQEVWPNPTNRLGCVEDVANLIAYVASPLAGYINGADLRADGGGVVTIN